MIERLLEHQTYFPTLGNWSTFQHSQLSVRGRQLYDRLLALLSSHLKSEPTSHISLFSPAFLISICDVIEDGRVNSSASQKDASILPTVLSKLREWRLVHNRYSSGGVHKLALDLADMNEASALCTGSTDISHTSHGRLRMKWVAYKSQGLLSSSQSGVLNAAQAHPHVFPHRRSSAGYAFFPTSRLSTPDSEDMFVSRRYHSMSGFRSGCSACRHPRISGSSTPPSPHMTPPRTPLGDINTRINAGIASPRHPKPTVGRTTTTKKTKKENAKSSQPNPRGAHVDENVAPRGPLGLGITFPRHRAHSPRPSHALASQDSRAPTASTGPRSPAHRVRQTKHSHAIASVDLLLPIGHARAHTTPSPTDLHPHRTRRASYTPFKGLPTSSSGRSDVQLPFWRPTHRRGPAPPVTSAVDTPTPGVSVRAQNPMSYGALARPWLAPSSGTRERRSVSAQTRVPRRDSVLCAPGLFAMRAR